MAKRNDPLLAALKAIRLEARKGKPDPDKIFDIADAAIQAATPPLGREE